MAQELKVQALFQTFGGWVVPIVVALVTWLYQMRKVKVEESDIILSRWKDFSDTHQEDMKLLKAEFAEYKAKSVSDFDAYKKQAMDEISVLRRRLNDVEEAFAKYRLEAADHIAARDVEIAGLKRAIAQNSQSTAYQLGTQHARSLKNREDIDHLSEGIAEALGEATGGEFQHEVDRLDRIGDNSIPKDEK